MLTRRLRLQLLAFVVIAVLGVTYVGLRYVGAGQWLGISGYSVKLELASAGGLYPNADVTYRGVSVGRVGGMTLTRHGITVELDISSSRHIPSRTRAVVADGSVIGEQYVDLQPRTSAGPFLHGGSVIHRSQTTLPPPVQKLLQSTDQFAGTLPKQALNTVVNQIYLATANASTDLGSLLRTSRSFFTEANQSLPQIESLIRSGQIVLRSQQLTSSAITQFSRNLVTIAAQLRSSHTDISTVLQRAAPALTQANRLIEQTATPLHSLLTNLLSTSQILLRNKDGLHALFVDLPIAVTDAGKVITPEGINTGLVPTFFDPEPCVAGYGGTHVRTGLNTSGNPGLNTSAGCRALLASGVDVRGSQNAP